VTSPRTTRALAPRSRRERPAKPALTRAGIIDAALVILRDEGLAKVTMRRIAAALDTGPASLYVYVRNTEDLHAQILDALLAPVSGAPASTAPGSGASDGTAPGSAATGGPGPWRDRLKTLLLRYRDVLVQHPEIARMALSTRPSGPNYLGLAEAILALLHEGGLSDRAAAWGVDLLLLYPTAIAVEHSGPDTGTDDLAALGVTIAAVDPARYPQIARLGGQLIEGDGAERFDWALNVLLNGLISAS
jgi:AcrR family transcriptional regulator